MHKTKRQSDSSKHIPYDYQLLDPNVKVPNIYIECYEEFPVLLNIVKCIYRFDHSYLLIAIIFEFQSILQYIKLIRDER